jgi:hypothetical protein
MTAATRVVQLRPDPSGAVGREPIAKVAISPTLSALG